MIIKPVTPLFSIVIPTKNRFNTVTQTIESVFSQNFSNFELIISDSSDVEKGKLRSWIEQRLGDVENIIFMETRSDLPLDANWEQSTLLAKGEYVLILADRWVMRGGVLSFLENVVKSNNPECVFWDSKLSINKSGQFINQINVENPIKLFKKNSSAVLDKILNFEGYLNDKVFTQAFPRGINSLYKNSLAKDIRNNYGPLFSPFSCDYTSGISLLVNTKNIIYVQDSLYIPIGSHSHGASSAIFGLDDYYKTLGGWRGIEIDSVFMTVLNDIESALRQNNTGGLTSRINVQNAILSMLCEIHYKEWHGSPLNTSNMKKTLMSYWDKNNDLEALQKLIMYDDKYSPSFIRLRKILQKIGLFYYFYNAKQYFSRCFRRSSGQHFLENLFKGRKVEIIE